MFLSGSTTAAVLLTLELALVTTLVLFIVGTPLAWWLAFTRSRLRSLVAAVTTLPIVLPPTVLGFYLLVFMAPEGPLGRLTAMLGLPPLVFSFPGLVIASVVYSLPFVVQPLASAFEGMGRRPLEVAASLGAGPADRFLRVVLPHCRTDFLSAAILGFAHTVGEFGVVIMIGGGIPGRTEVLSVRIFNQVEALNYDEAHTLSAGLVVFSLLVMLLLFGLRRSREEAR